MNNVNNGIEDILYDDFIGFSNKEKSDIFYIIHYTYTNIVYDKNENINIISSLKKINDLEYNIIPILKEKKSIICFYCTYKNVNFFSIPLNKSISNDLLVNDCQEYIKSIFVVDYDNINSVDIIFANDNIFLYIKPNKNINFDKFKFKFLFLNNFIDSSFETLIKPNIINIFDSLYSIDFLNTFFSSNYIGKKFSDENFNNELKTILKFFLNYYINKKRIQYIEINYYNLFFSENFKSKESFIYLVENIYKFFYINNKNFFDNDDKSFLFFFFMNMIINYFFKKCDVLLKINYDYDEIKIDDKVFTYSIKHYFLKLGFYIYNNNKKRISLFKNENLIFTTLKGKFNNKYYFLIEKFNQNLTENNENEIYDNNNKKKFFIKIYINESFFDYIKQIFHDKNIYLYDNIKKIIMSFICNNLNIHYKENYFELSDNQNNSNFLFIKSIVDVDEIIKKSDENNIKLSSILDKNSFIFDDQKNHLVFGSCFNYYLYKSGFSEKYTYTDSFVIFLEKFCGDIFFVKNFFKSLIFGYNINYNETYVYVAKIKNKNDKFLYDLKKDDITHINFFVDNNKEYIGFKIKLESINYNFASFYLILYFLENYGDIIENYENIEGNNSISEMEIEPPNKKMEREDDDDDDDITYNDYLNNNIYVLAGKNTKKVNCYFCDGKIMI